MHKGVILLVKAEDREDAIAEANGFLDGYLDKVFDWHSIGGRWGNLLAPPDKVSKFNEWAVMNYEGKKLSGVDIFNIDAKWGEFGLEGSSPYSMDTYGNEDQPYNVMPLKDCIDAVKEYLPNVQENIENNWSGMLRRKEEYGDGFWSAYHAKEYADWVNLYFSFNRNVYDVPGDAGESIPDDIEGYWAVVVDMHN